MVTASSTIGVCADERETLAQVLEDRPRRSGPRHEPGEVELVVAHEPSARRSPPGSSAALIANAGAMPNAPIVSPATAGPTTRAPLNIAELIATALPMSRGPTISIAND